MKIEELQLMGIGDVRAFLGVSPQRLDELLKKYEIPHQAISSGKVFLKKDVEAFQEMRRKKGLI